MGNRVSTERQGDETDPRAWQNIVRSLNNLSNEDKIVIVQERYNEIYTELLALEELAKVRSKRNKRSNVVDNSTQTQEADRNRYEENLVTANRRLEFHKRLAELQRQNLETEVNIERSTFAKELEDLTDKYEKMKRLNRTLEANIQKLRIQIISSEPSTTMQENITDEDRSQASSSTRQSSATQTEEMDESVSLREQNFQDREEQLVNANLEMKYHMQVVELQLENREAEIMLERKLFEQKLHTLNAKLAKNEDINRILEANLQKMRANKEQYTGFESSTPGTTEVPLRQHEADQEIQSAALKRKAQIEAIDASMIKIPRTKSGDQMQPVATTSSEICATVQAMPDPELLISPDLTAQKHLQSETRSEMDEKQEHGSEAPLEHAEIPELVQIFPIIDISQVDDPNMSEVRENQESAVAEIDTETDDSEGLDDPLFREERENQGENSAAAEPDTETDVDKDEGDPMVGGDAQPGRELDSREPDYQTEEP